jgi:hypothetical protein
MRHFHHHEIATQHLKVPLCQSPGKVTYNHMHASSRCNFWSQSADKAGLPVGGVHYPISRVKTSEECYAVYWKEVVYLLNSDDREVSTTLLIIPEFGIGNIEGFTSFTDTLTSPLVPLGLERFIQLVYFHPQWVFRDGADRAGEGAAANFARRSPFPMINILRTPQVRLAQKSIPTGLVYTQNEETLADVGAEKLQDMLMDRNWDELADKRVDRRSIVPFPSLAPPPLPSLPPSSTAFAPHPQLQPPVL